MAGTRGLYARMHAFHLPSRGANFQEARSAELSRGTVRQSRMRHIEQRRRRRLARVFRTSAHSFLSTRSGWSHPGLAQRALILATKRGTQHRCAVFLLSATTTV